MTKAGTTEKPTNRKVHSDQISLTATIIGMIAASGGGAIASLAAWWILKRPNFPAFSSSNVLKAVSTLCTSVTIIIVAALLIWWALDARRDSRLGSVSAGDSGGSADSDSAGEAVSSGGSDSAVSPASSGDSADENQIVTSLATTVNRPRWRVWLTYLVCYLSPAALVTTVLSIPLSVTRLYLDGISVDQAFRTQYLTRMTAQFGLHDMAYAGLPTFYPAGWFLTGGRFAHLIGLEGWAAYQPWAIVTLAATASMLVPVWQRITGNLPLATTIAIMTTTVMLSMSSEEPYAAITGMGIPAAAVLAVRAFNGSRWSAVGTSVFLGISATLYTLFTGVNALAVVLISIVVAVRRRSFKPLLHLILIGAGSILIAATVWAPYIRDLLTKPHGPTATAQHYLPKEGTEIPVPMFTASFAGVLCFIGLCWLILRIRNRMAYSLAIAVIAYYLWVLLSMLATLKGTTLLGFRLEPPIVMLLTTAGILAIADLKTEGIAKLYPTQVRSYASKITAVLGVLAALIGAEYISYTPYRISDAINLAYSDTDGNAHRADLFPADSGTFYPDIEKFIDREPTDTVVLTDEKSFMAYHPYLAFQAFTAHYANPLGEFEKRNEAIEQWSRIEDPDKLLDAMDNAPWRRPDVMIFRSDLDNPLWSINIADDIYPNDPNVRFRPLSFHKSAFAGWDVKQIGPYIVAKHP